MLVIDNHSIVLQIQCLQDKNTAQIDLHQVDTNIKVLNLAKSYYLQVR